MGLLCINTHLSLHCSGLVSDPSCWLPFISLFTLFRSGLGSQPLTPTHCSSDTFIYLFFYLCFYPGHFNAFYNKPDFIDFTYDTYDQFGSLLK